MCKVGMMLMVCGLKLLRNNQSSPQKGSLFKYFSAQSCRRNNGAKNSSFTMHEHGRTKKKNKNIIINSK